MFSETAKFEIHYHLRQNLIYVMSGVSFLLFFLATASPNVQIGGGGANVNLNAAMSIVNMLGAVSVITILVSIAFTANSVVRDYDYKMIEFFLSRPFNRASFIYGRFVGSFVFGVLVFMAGLLGILAGEMMPWLDPERLGPVNPSAYVYGTLVYGIPNLFIFSSIFFCVAGVTRSLGITYAVAIGFLLLSALLDTFTERATVQLTSMLDPFGSTAIEEVTRYWTPFELNTNLPAIEGALLLNRAVWLGIAILFLVGSYWLFPTSINRSNKVPKKSNKPEVDSQSSRDFTGLNSLVVHQRFDMAAQISQFWSQTKLEIRGIVFTVPFAIVMLLGMVQVVGGAMGNLGNIVGTSVYPTTSNMITVINGSFSLPLLVVLIYMSAEMMGRDSGTKSNTLVDAMPHPNWIVIAAKWVGLACVIAMMLLAVTLAAIGVQLYEGYYEISLVQYFVGLLFFFQFPLYLAVTLSLFFYVMTRQKYVAMFLMVAYFVLTLMMPALGFQHYLYRMAQVGMPYSDFTGYSQNLIPHLWQTFYWSGFGCLMLLLVHLFWPRGIEDNWANRVKVAKGRLTHRVTAMFLVAGTLFVTTGVFIFYNTNILNEYRTSDDFETLQAKYEKTYKRYEDLPQLEIENVFANVDIYPSRREVEITGYYDLVNRTQAPLHELHLTIPLEISVAEIELPAAELTLDEELHYRIYKLKQPVLPGQTIRLDFDLEWLTPGFANSGHSPKLTRNGTFFDNTDAFPLLGYQASVELQDNNDRRQHELDPVQRLPDLDDASALNTSAAFGGSRVNFESVVSTEIGQHAIAPGYLEKEWQEDGRHYFHYKMDQPIWSFFSFLSADYEVVLDKWQDVALEVYYIHGENVDTMIESSKDSLEYFTKNFSPYQYRQFRIMEFPQFQGRFAQSFPNTIPFSEAIGFTADLRDESELDYVYYVTAHELAHQWWAHQVLGANVQGSTMIIETLAQYSALMVMEQKFGQAHMQRFLAFELDSYLRGRGSEVIEELPLYRVENQAYIHYRKGSVVFYALKDLVGEAVINDALSAFIDQYAFKGAPYPTTRDLLALIRERADEQYANTITDMFERIVLFDLQVEEAKVKELADGKFEVSFDVRARKFEANGEGEETQIILDDWIDIGVLGPESELTEVRDIIQVEKIRLNSETNSFTMVVDEKPFFVGIDPLNKLIDRNPEDNLKEL